MPWTTQEIQQFYDSYSKSYDAETSADTYPSPHILSCWLLQQLNSRKTQDSLSQRNILDIGCGTGQSSSIFFAQSLAEDRVNRLEFSVTGVDASPKMLEIAAKYPFKKLLNIDIEVELMDHFKGGSLDGIICVGVIDFVRNVPQLLSNFASLLLKDGYAVLTLPETANSNLNHFTLDDMKSMIMDAGFSIEKNDRLMGYVDSENGTTTFYQGFLLKPKQSSSN